MNTNQVALAANRGDLAGADFQIDLVLRSQVIPAFLEDVGRIGWRTKRVALASVLNHQTYTLPADFFEIDDVWVVGATDPLDFIADDPVLVSQADSQTAPGTWTGYYLVHDTADPTRWAIKFNAPAGTTGTTVYVSYYWYIPFEDDTEDADLRRWIPEQYHWALVELLRREIIDDRFGQGDQRYGTANAKYQEWLKRIVQKRQLGPRGNRADYMR